MSEILRIIYFFYYIGLGHSSILAYVDCVACSLDTARPRAARSLFTGLIPIEAPVSIVRPTPSVLRSDPFASPSWNNLVATKARDVPPARSILRACIATNPIGTVRRLTSPAARQCQSSRQGRSSFVLSQGRRGTVTPVRACGWGRQHHPISGHQNPTSEIVV